VLNAAGQSLVISTIYDVCLYVFKAFYCAALAYVTLLPCGVFNKLMDDALFFSAVGLQNASSLADFEKYSANVKIIENQQLVFLFVSFTTFVHRYCFFAF